MRGSEKRGWGRALGGWALAVTAAAGCGEPEPDVSSRDGLSQRPSVARVPAPLPAAHCDVQVQGLGMLDLEADYLPQVIACENNGANLEALKAQAISARSVAYYAIETSGSICDSQGCQVFTCGQEVDALHIQAVQETSGQYLMYNGTLTYGFYVAGDDSVVAPGCIGNDANAATEHWVTYNDGRSGQLVEQTELGYVHAPDEPGYGQNRGCMSQWGGRCLENDLGYDAMSILRFYYGDDIEVVKASGDCVLEGGTTGGATTGDGSTGASPTSWSPATTTTTFGDESGSTAESSETGWVGTGGAEVGTDAVPEGVAADGDAGCACRSGRGARDGGLRWTWLFVCLALLHKNKRPDVREGRRGA